MRPINLFALFWLIIATTALVAQDAKVRTIEMPFSIEKRLEFQGDCQPTYISTVERAYKFFEVEIDPTLYSFQLLTSHNSSEEFDIDIGLNGISLKKLAKLLPKDRNIIVVPIGTNQKKKTDDGRPYLESIGSLVQNGKSLSDVQQQGSSIICVGKPNGGEGLAMYFPVRNDKSPVLKNPYISCDNPIVEKRLKEKFDYRANSKGGYLERCKSYFQSGVRLLELRYDQIEVHGENGGVRPPVTPTSMTQSPKLIITELLNTETSKTSLYRLTYSSQNITNFDLQLYASRYIGKIANWSVVLQSDKQAGIALIKNGSVSFVGNQNAKNLSFLIMIKQDAN